MSEEASASLSELRTPRAAGITGVLFAGLFAAAVTLERIAAPGNPTSERDGFSGVDPALILVASHLVAFAGIFFLWFIGVVRSRIGSREDQFFSSVLFGSGIVFVASLYASVAVAAAGVAEMHRGRRRRSSRCASPLTPATSSGMSSPPRRPERSWRSSRRCCEAWPSRRGG